MQDTLNLLRTSREDPSKSAYEDLQGVFNYNKTPMVVLGTKALAFVDPDKQAAWQSHRVDAFVVGRCPLHYCLLEFFNPKTRIYLEIGTYKLYPRHSTVPTINKVDRTLITASKMLEKLQATVTSNAQSKIMHNQALDKLTKILNQEPQEAAPRQSPMVRQEATPQRVVPQQPPRVGATNSTADPTDPATIRTT